MRYHIHIVAFCLASVALMWGCSSPTDLDTPREKEFDPEETVIPDPGVFPIQSAVLSITEQDNGAQPQVNVFDLQSMNDAEVEVTDEDVLLTLPNLRWDVPTPSANNTILQILQLGLLKLSVINPATTYSIAGDPNGGSGVGAYMRVRPVGLSGNVDLPADGSDNKVVITFTHDGTKKEIQAAISIDLLIQNRRQPFITGELVITY